MLCKYTTQDDLLRIVTSMGCTGSVLGCMSTGMPCCHIRVLRVAHSFTIRTKGINEQPRRGA